MTPDDTLARLSLHPVLARFDVRMRQRWVDASRVLELIDGAAVGPDGHLAAYLLIVLDGELRLELDAHFESPRFVRGEWLGAGVTPADIQSQARALACGPCVVLATPVQAIRAAIEEHGLLELFLPVPLQGEAEQASAAVARASSDALFSTTLSAMLEGPAVTIAPTVTILDAAKLMTKHAVSSVLLVDGDALVGVLTDKDLRTRVVAAAVPLDRPVAEIATRHPLTMQGHATALEALMTMTRNNLHHLPVLEGERLRGLVTANDLVRRQSTSAVHLAAEIRRQVSLEGLARVARKIGTLQSQLAAADSSAHVTGQVVTSVADALTVRLIELAQETLGPAPVPFCWVAAGSQARSEQTARSDQDNCLVLDDGYVESLHGAYFDAFARFVCDGLDACGYVHCPGEMMAMTARWRQPKSRWAAYFQGWVRQPEPTALMLTCVFFDLRAIHGTRELLDDLRAEVLRATKGNSIFLAYMVGNALKHRPPLGLFGQISTPLIGELAGRIDLKHNGVVPIVDLARVYALAGGLPGVATRERLLEAASAGEISEESARDLREAHEFISLLRIRHQAQCLREGRPADNLVPLASLSNLERRQLRDAFGIVARLQSVLGQRYHAGRF